MRRIQIWSALAFSLLIMVGCKSTGSGTGASNTGDVQAHFTWEQSEATSGALTAIVSYPGGLQETYSGKFYQITRNSTVDTLGPLWYPWHPGWGGWAHWGAAPDEAFITHYTGHVLANLAGPDGKRMRCQFQLLRADEGMKGGGEGQCQLSSGQNIRADFPPS
ncbi:MAG TPA: hypothetical protein VFE08_07690 [Candidatus Sulfotelmatobacter sp.]|nr:hypothetical protein [Candidatus Sulfotelmatobacter sp.]